MNHRAIFFFFFDDFVKHAVIFSERVVSWEQIIKLDLTNLRTLLWLGVIRYKREVENRGAIVRFDQD